MIKNLFLVLITLCIFVFVSMVGIKSFRDVYGVNGYTLIYYKNNLEEYKIKTKNNEILVEKRDVVICVKAPCEGPLRDSYKISINKRYADFFHNNFNDGEKEKTLSKSDLSEGDLNILKEIIRDEDKITYTILDRKEYSPYKVRGYYVDRDSKTITIASGEKPSGGYSVEINAVQINEKDVKIYVRENKPNEFVTTSLTQPVASISFNEIPNSINVYNIDTKEEFSRNILCGNNDITCNLAKDKLQAKHKERGYYINFVDNIVYISSGEKPSAAYKIEIEKVVFNDNTVTIYVYEDKQSGYTKDEKSYPTTAINFSSLPENIIVKSLDEKEEFINKS